MKFLLFTLLLACSAPVLAQKLSVKIINRQDSETDYSYVVPGYSNSQSNANVNCNNIGDSVNCNGSGTTTGYSTAVVRDYLATLTAPEQTALKSAIQAGRVVPAEHDGRLLATTRTRIGRPLANDEKSMLRNELKTQLGI